MSEEQKHTPGTAPAAKLEKAGCGIRFGADELQEGIDFSAAEQLKPAPDTTPETDNQDKK
ncbi:MAG: hypothetical protein MI794_07965 [Pseudomonadales bacterium]|uniref:hypothetical protein n=1 Tax=Marinobacter xestospongiae TaxID=994319 RepID=UPI0020061447|nr:hypothetical protein [Marinobacter xestospongiae]MCG8517912.1 hypothetical protein [Pseudomonadales bacterium]MCK7565403.1 hypothetical protein [Marinobacter xestospongiae]